MPDPQVLKIRRLTPSQNLPTYHIPGQHRLAISPLTKSIFTFSFTNLVVKLRERHLRFDDDDDQTEQRTGQRVVGDALPTLRHVLTCPDMSRRVLLLPTLGQNVAKSEPVADVLSGSR